MRYFSIFNPSRQVAQQTLNQGAASTLVERAAGAYSVGFVCNASALGRLVEADSFNKTKVITLVTAGRAR